MRGSCASDRAGSNFAATLPLYARQHELPVPTAVIMLGAFADFTQERWPSFQEQAPRGFVYDSPFFAFIRTAHLPTTPRTEPLASPIYGDLTGYPPHCLATGTHDPIIDSARKFASLVEKAGSPADGRWPAGTPHGFYSFPGVHHERDVAFDRWAAFLEAQLSR